MRSWFVVPSLVLAALACSATTPEQQAGAAPSSTVRPTAQSPDATMLRYPDVGIDEIVFVYANDLWTVDRDGGRAAPLASPKGAERFPKYSPDGATIAFLGNYDGNRDLYTIPAIGGVPVRVTHHPSTEVLCDWTPDGELLYYGNGQAGLPRASNLYRVGAGGGLPRALPLPYGTVGAIAPDGKWLAYTPHTRDTATWKRYRGGMATDIWLFHLEEHTSRKITDWEGTDTLPMWNGKILYYLSDAGPNHKLNLWSFDTTNDRREQVTAFEEFDVKWPSIGPGPHGTGEIVFQNGSQLHLLNLADGTSRPVPITIPGAVPTLRTQRIDASDFVQSWDLSPTGKRAVVQARGDVWTLPAEKGSPRNLTRTSGAAERNPAWSPDGRWIAYFSDATGEYELYITQSDGKGETKQLTSGSATYYFSAIWSPDSKHLVVTDKAWELTLHTVETGESRVIDRDPLGFGMNVSWSHDSRWLTFSHGTPEMPNPRIWLYDVENSALRAVTSGMFTDTAPVFDRKGEYLFFASGRSFTFTSSDLFLDDNFLYEDTELLLAVPLTAEVKAPWLEESDEESWEDEEEDDAEDGESSGDDEETEEVAEAPVVDDGVSGTWEGIANTPDGALEFTLVLTLHDDGSVTGTMTSPLYAGTMSGSWDAATGRITGTIALSVGEVIVMDLVIDGDTMTGTGTSSGVPAPVEARRTSKSTTSDSEDGDDEETEAKERVEIELEGFERRAFALPVPRGTFHSLVVNDKNQLLYSRQGEGIKLFDLGDDDKAEQTVAAGQGGFGISANGKKLIVPAGNTASIFKAGAGASGKRVVTSGMHAAIEPREEWRQLFLDVWRLQRDFFYVENMHGVDWPGIRDRYATMVDACINREDVSYVLGEMISELNVGHSYYSGGDTESAPRVNVGLLGVDWELDQGAYRIAKIVEGAAWDIDARNPLRRPGVDVDEGDYVLAVNGVPLDPTQDPYAAFEGLAGRTVTLTVNAAPTIDDEARDVVIQPLGSEAVLRYRAWIERNRAYVEAKTDGQVGYLYVPDTMDSGRNDFYRQYYGQLGKKALIVDERWNSGGYDPGVFVEAMNRPVVNFWARRDGIDVPQPANAHQGPKCMLINGMAGSGGDNFPWRFRHDGVGQLIGTRTWGGLVGLSGNPGLIDGGMTTVPNWGFYETDGTWGVEGHGVDPDIEVVDDPALMVDGGDPQLDAAIELMLLEIEAFEYILPRRPTSPDRSGMGLEEADK